MISEKLKLQMQLLETATYPLWQKANSKERQRICEKLGKHEAQQIIKEIHLKSSKLKTNGKN